MKKTCTLCMLAIVLSTNSFSQEVDTLWAQKFQYLMDSVMLQNNFRGATAGLYSPKYGGWIGYGGIAQTGVPVTDETRFGIGSNTKLFTSVIILMLQEAGLVSLDDQLVQWLPSIPYVDSAITIRQLLKHETGLFDYFNDNPAFVDSVLTDTSHFFTPQEVTTTLGPPHFQAGHGYSYSNTNYLLAGLIIEAVTGESFTQVLHELLLEPLGMSQTFVGGYEIPNGPISNEWFWGDEISNTPMPSFYSAVFTAGAIFSTARDMTWWYYQIIKGNILSPASKQQLLDFEPSSLYGLGICTDYGYYDGVFTTFLHVGSTLSFLSVAAYDTITNTSFFIVSNSYSNYLEIFNPLYILYRQLIPKSPANAGISQVSKPWLDYCSNVVEPVVSLVNAGSEPLTSVEIHYSCDNQPETIYNWSGSLSPGSNTGVYLPAMNIPEGAHTFRAYTSLPEGVPDTINENDTCYSKFIVIINNVINAPYEEGFEGSEFPPEKWSLGSNSYLQWNRTKLTASAGNYCLVRNNFNDWSSITMYDINMPVISLNNLTDAVLRFKHAYAFDGDNNDMLTVSVSTDCGASWQSIFQKSGPALATAPNTINAFYPEPSEWAENTLSLSAFTGNILIRFRSNNSFGTQLYVDEVKVENTSGVAYNSSNNLVKIYPNPTTGKLFINELPDHENIRLWDVKGNLLQEMYASDNFIELDISAYNPGIYMVQYGIFTRKIVKY